MSDLRITKRQLAVGAGLAALAACMPAPPATPAPAPIIDEPRFASLESRIGGRIGVAAWNTGSGAWLVRRPDERFAMCSTFKWLLAAQARHAEDNIANIMQEELRYGRAQLLDHSPRARQNLSRGWMTVEECCAAAVVVSDNTAANLLLSRFEGPEGFTRFIRGNADSVTRLDRTEPGLNENLPGDPRDTTTPRSMANLLYHFLLREGPLTLRSRDVLIGWLIACETGRERLRAGLPNTWRVGDKTGTSAAQHNATNDVAIAWPKNADGSERAPILIAAFLSESSVDADARNAAHAEIASIIVDTWG